MIAVNLARIIAIALVLLRLGPGAAVLFHDYLSQFFIFILLGLFWFLSNEYILEPDRGSKPRIQAMRERFGASNLSRSRVSERRRTMGLSTLAILFSSLAMGGFALIASVRAESENWWNDDWNYRKLITQGHTKVDSDLTGFPMLIKGTYLELVSHAQADGDDIAFVGFDNSTQLDHEIECFDGSTGELIAWVRVDLSSASDTCFWMYYGNGAVANQQNPTGVWDSNFEGLWHLIENPSVDSCAYDDTSNDNDGTFNGGMDSSDQLDGKIDGSLDFDNSDDYLNLGDIGTNSFAAITVEAWIYHRDTGDDSVVSKSTGKKVKDNIFLLGVYGGVMRVRLGTDGPGGRATSHDSSEFISTNQWTHVAFTWDSADETLRFYGDGQSRGA